MLQLFFYPLIFISSLFIPKQKYKWCFGEWFGEKFCDNSKYLFEYTKNNTNIIRPIWITKNKDIRLELKKNGYEVYLSTSIKGIWHQLTAKVFFSNVNSKDFFYPCITPRSIYIQLWHGSPIKKIGFDTIKPRSVKYYISNLRTKTIDKYRYIVSPSRTFDAIFKSAFNLESKNIIRSPYPRCDGLFLNENHKKKIIKKLALSQHNKIISYIPTHRDEGKSADTIKIVIKEILKNDAFLKENKITFIFKPHFYDSHFFTNIKSSENLKVIMPNDNFDLYELLSITDIMVTDYSSIFFDFDITGKETIFHAPDLSSYISKNRDLYFDYKDLCGNYTTNTRELLLRIKEGSNFEKTDDSIFNENKTNKCSEFLYKKLMVILYDKSE
ncbi:CDP-glycerol glycerophosphotransferase family protein [Spongorhabdus nitratireducens]